MLGHLSGLRQALADGMNKVDFRVRIVSRALPLSEQRGPHHQGRKTLSA